MSNTGSGGSARLIAIICSLLIGGVGGYCLRSFTAPAAGAASASTAPGGAGMGRGGGGGFGGFGGGGGQAASSATALPRLVRNLGTIEKLQNKGLSAEQSQKLLPVLTQLQSPDKLSEQDCAAKITAIEAVLTPDQKQALQDLTPVRGGRGGGGGGGRGMGGGRGGGGGFGGGGGQDPEHPFASERNKQSLNDLITSLHAPQK